ncbi:MAG: amidohydrolase [Chloroflexi bacterium]|nr:amidohydrolase [Chloroflexota bacterium]
MTKFNCISADTHVVEPPNVWLDHTEPAFRDRAPHVVRENGNDVFKFDGGELLGIAGWSSAGKPRNEFKMHGTFENDIYPGAYDPHARLKDMAADGVEAEVLYPSLSMRLYAIDDIPLRNACFRAYNSWIAEFCTAYPDRFKGIMLTDLEDIAAAIAELHRGKKLGLAGAAVALYLGDASVQYDDPSFDPFWATAQDLDIPVSLHVLTDKEGKSALTGPVGRVFDAHFVQLTLTPMIFGGVFQRFPRLRVVSAELDAGWAPYFIERMDYIFEIHTAMAQTGDTLRIAGGDVLPSEYFKRNVYMTFMRDRSAVLARDQIGLGHIMWATDYPHLDSTWPNSRKMHEYLFEGVPEPDKHRIIAANASEVYGFG